MRRAIRYSMLSAMVILLGACGDEALLHEPVVGAQEAPVGGGARRDRCAVDRAAGPQAVPDRRDCGIDDAGDLPAEI